MRNFLKRLFFFSAPVFIGLLLLWFVNPEPAFRYQYIEGDCGAFGKWIWPRISDTESAVDLLFLGSSRTMHAMDDSLLYDLFQKCSGIEKGVLNLGYCRLGRDLQSHLLEEVLAFHNPEYLILEVRESESTNSHAMFPYLAPRRAVWAAPMIGNQQFVRNLWHNWQLHFAYARYRFLNSDSIILSNRESKFGYLANTNMADPQLLQKAKERNQQPVSVKSPGNFPGFYLNEIQRHCRDNDINLIFWYIPRYGTEGFIPASKEWYQSAGTFLQAPPSLLSDERLWMDEIHLNDQGTKKMTNWFFSNFEW